MHANHKTPSNRVYAKLSSIYRFISTFKKHERNNNNKKIENATEMNLRRYQMAWNNSTVYHIIWIYFLTGLAFYFEYIHICMLMYSVYCILYIPLTTTNIFIYKYTFDEKKKRKKGFLDPKITRFHSQQLQDTEEFGAAFFAVVVGLRRFCFLLFLSLSLNESKTMRNIVSHNTICIVCGL